MTKVSFLFLAFMAMTSVTVAQDKPANKKSSADNIYTSLRPSDGQGVVFNSKEEMEAKVQYKKENIIALIKTNESDTAAVRKLRYELWRFENAVVATPKK